MTRAKERIENKKIVSQQFSLQIYQIELAEFPFSSKKHINQHCLHALSLHLLFSPRSSRLKQRPVTDLVRIIFNRLANVDSSHSFGAAQICEMAPENRTSYHGSYRKCFVRSETQKILTLCPKMTGASRRFWLAHIIQRLL